MIPIDQISLFYALYVVDVKLPSLVKFTTSGAMYFMLPTFDYVLNLFFPDLHSLSRSISEKILTNPKSDILMELSLRRRF